MDFGNALNELAWILKQLCGASIFTLFDGFCKTHARRNFSTHSIVHEPNKGASDAKDSYGMTKRGTKVSYGMTTKGTSGNFSTICTLAFLQKKRLSIQTTSF
jgi:hypothetical protein